MTDSKPKPLKMNPPALEPGPEDRLLALGLTLPKPAAPVAGYVPTVEANGMLYVSGQVSFQNNQLMVGRLGDDRDLAYGVQAARACGLMVLAQIKAALGSLEVDMWPSAANFILFRPRGRDGAEVWQELVDRGVLVRNCASWPGLEGCLRVTLGTVEEDDEFLAALTEVLTGR